MSTIDVLCTMYFLRSSSYSLQILPPTTAPLFDFERGIAESGSERSFYGTFFKSDQYGRDYEIRSLCKAVVEGSKHRDAAIRGGCG